MIQFHCRVHASAPYARVACKLSRDIYKRNVMSQNPKIIAVAGKGGVGKTSLAAVIVKLLCQEIFLEQIYQTILN